MRAPEIDVQLETGEQVPLSSLHAERKLTLVFLRHLGCTFCREQVRELRLHPNLNVVFVSMGDVEQTRAFKERMKSPHTFICDPERKLHAIFGLGNGTAKQIFNPKVFARGMGATIRGNWVGQMIGDPWQMPGVFVIDPAGEVVWEYRSVNASDNISADRAIELG